MTLQVLTARRVASVQRDLVTAAGVSVSPFDGTVQVQAWGGAWWRYSISINRMKAREARSMSGMLSSLRGPVGVFLFEDPGAKWAGDVPKLHSNPVVEGDQNQSGAISLATTGWDRSTKVLGVGDFFSLGAEAATRLYQVTADVVTDVSGNATLSFVPPLRSSPVDGDEIEVAAPKVALRLTSTVPTSFVSGGRYNFSIDAREAL